MNASDERNAGRTKDQDPQKESERVALRLLTIRNRSIRELRQGLQKKHLPTCAIEKQIQRLQRLGFLDDRKFALERAVGLGAGRGWGPRKIKLDLKQKGIDPTVIEQALEQAYGSQTIQDVMQAVLEKRFRWDSHPPNDAKQMAKLQRFLLGRGFEAEAVFQFLSNYRSPVE